MQSKPEGTGCPVAVCHVDLGRRNRLDELGLGELVVVGDFAAGRGNAACFDKRSRKTPDSSESSARASNATY